MKPENYIFEQIEDYLNKDLEEPQRQAFEKAVQESPELSQKVRVHELANDMVIENRLLSVNEALVSHHISQNGASKVIKYGIVAVLTATSIGAILYISNSLSEPKSPASTVIVNEKLDSKPKELTIIDQKPTKAEGIVSEKIASSSKPAPKSVVSEPITQVVDEKTMISQNNKPLEHKPTEAQHKPVVVNSTNSSEPIASKPQSDKCAG